MNQKQERALQLATEAGHILLENGAEISRVEESMDRIATHYGVEEKGFFVLSNGIIATGDGFASAKFIPIKGTQLSKVVEVNQLSRDVTDGKCTLDDLEARLKGIRNSASKPWWELLIGITIGIMGFCITFGGSFMDTFASLFTGLLLGVFITFAGKHLSRIFNNLIGGLVGGLLSILACRIFGAMGVQLHLPNIIIGNMIAMVPGVPFTNGIRDLANGDYIAGVTRLLDAFIVFFCLAVGVIVAFLLDEFFFDDLEELGNTVFDSVTSRWYIQLAAAFVGTLGFAVLFGAPRRYYLACGFVGMLGWAVYIFTDSILLASLVLAIVSHLFAVAQRCPVTVFLICGIIPLVPGGGLFWTLCYMLTDQLRLAFNAGIDSLKVTIAIAGGIIIGVAIFDRLLKNFKGTK